MYTSLSHRGFLPEATSLDLDLLPDYHEAYIRTYIERDVRLILTQTNLEQFRRFYQLSSMMSAQEINYSEFGRELGVDYKVAQRWLSVLQATFQWSNIPAFHVNDIKKISKKPKGVFL